MASPKTDWGKFVTSARDGRNFQLSKQAELALRKKDKHFQILKAGDFQERIPTYFKSSDSNQGPMAILGRFDNNESTDLAVLGHSRGLLKAYILSTGARGISVKKLKSSIYSSDERPKNFRGLASTGPINAFLRLSDQCEQRSFRIPRNRNLLKVEVIFGRTTFHRYNSKKYEEVEIVGGTMDGCSRVRGKIKVIR